MALSQTELGRLFGRTQQWASKQQRRTDDPLPGDLEGAQAWAVRHGIIPASGPASSAPALTPQGELAKAKTEETLLKIGERRGALLPREEIEAREIQAAAEFRLAAVEYPRRARAIVERYITDASIVERIFAELEPLAAELLNKADPAGALKTHSRDEVRQALQARVEEILAAC